MNSPQTERVVSPKRQTKRAVRPGKEVRLHIEPQTPVKGQNGIAAPVTDMLDLIMSSLEDDKAVEITRIDLEGKTSIADYMVVASGRSHRQVAAIASHLVTRLKETGFKSARVEGLPQADWVLIDAGDIIVHVFRPEVRSFYNLEKMWALDFEHDVEPS